MIEFDKELVKQSKFEIIWWKSFEKLFFKLIRLIQQKFRRKWSLSLIKNLKRMEKLVENESLRFFDENSLKNYHVW